MPPVGFSAAWTPKKKDQQLVTLQQENETLITDLSQLAARVNQLPSPRGPVLSEGEEWRTEPQSQPLILTDNIMLKSNGGLFGSQLRPPGSKHEPQQ